jgi:hypothetical protein
MAGKFNLPKMYLSTDWQAYILNWVGRKDRHTAQMTRQEINFDDSLEGSVGPARQSNCCRAIEVHLLAYQCC